MNVLNRLTKDFLNNFTTFDFSSNLGSYGDIIFKVARGNVLTPDAIDLSILKQKIMTILEKLLTQSLFVEI